MFSKIISTTSSSPQESPFGILCPISLEPFKSALLITKCGHSIDESSLTQWKDSQKTKSTLPCPCCREPFSPKEDVVKNYQLQTLVNALGDRQKVSITLSDQIPEPCTENLKELYQQGFDLVHSKTEPDSDNFLNIFKRIQTTTTISPHIVGFQRLLLSMYELQKSHYKVLEVAWHGAQYKCESRIFFLNKIGSALYESGQLSQALEYFKLSLGNAELLDKGDPVQKQWLEHTFQHICTINFKQGDETSAKEYLSKFLDTFPGNSWALQALRVLEKKSKDKDPNKDDM